MQEEGKTPIQHLLDKLPERFRAPEFLQFVRYLIAGGLTTVVNLGMYALLREIFHVEINFSQNIAVVCALVFAYFPNKFFVFRRRCASRQALFREAISFFSSRVFTAVLESVGVALLITELKLHDIIGVSDFWIKAALTVIVVLLNYLLSRVLVFRKTKEKRNVNA